MRAGYAFTLAALVAGIAALLHLRWKQVETMDNPVEYGAPEGGSWMPR